MSVPEIIGPPEIPYAAFSEQAGRIFEKDPFTTVTEGVRIPVPVRDYADVRDPKITVCRNRSRADDGQVIIKRNATLTYETIHNEYVGNLHTLDLSKEPSDDLDHIIADVLRDYADSSVNDPLTHLADQILESEEGSGLFFRTQELFQVTKIKKRMGVLLRRTVDNMALGERGGISLVIQPHTQFQDAWQIWPWRISRQNKTQDDLGSIEYLYDMFGKMERVAETRAMRYE